MEARERLWLTADRARLVAEGDADAAVLYAAPGDAIPDEAAERFGLKDGRLGAKARRGGETKERKGAADKDAEPPTAGSGGGLKVNKPARGE